MGMDPCTLRDEIGMAYHRRDYQEAIRLINEYMDNKELAIYENLLDLYIKSLFKLGYIDEGIKNLQIASRLFPDNYHDCRLTQLYIIHDRDDLAKERLNNGNFNENDYYHIAKTYMEEAKYDDAIYYFKVFLALTNNEELKEFANKFLKKIERFLTHGTFIDISYERLKKQGKNLESGHVVYVKKKSLLIGADDKAEIRPYMIWKIEDKNVYAFPVTMKTVGYDSYRFYSQNYPNFEYDRRLKDSIVCLQKEDIHKVIDRIHDNDYILAINDVYQKFCKTCQYPSMFTKKFLQEMHNSIVVEPNDVLICYDVAPKEKHCYFVLNVEEDYYDVFKLEKDEFPHYKIVGREKLPKSRYICYINKLKDDQLLVINSQIKEQYTLNKNI